jgi:predicted enzyme involved in methoxymalonyl-ACP biosynthesis
MAPPQPSERAHVDRVLRTAAAFSLSGEKRDLSEGDVDRLLRGRCLLISVSDKLSAYGPSGVASFSTESTSLVVEDLALSCPVLGKQVEFAVVLGLAQAAESLGCSKIVFRYQASGRNQFMLRFLESIADVVPDAGFTLATAEANARIRNAAVSPGTWTLEIGM